MTTPGYGLSTRWYLAWWAFRPDVLVTQHGTDTHRDDPLADLNLSIDGQRTSYEEALRRLTDTSCR